MVSVACTAQPCPPPEPTEHAMWSRVHTVEGVETGKAGPRGETHFSSLPPKRLSRKDLQLRVQGQQEPWSWMWRTPVQRPRTSRWASDLLVSDFTCREMNPAHPSPVQLDTVRWKRNFCKMIFAEISSPRISSKCSSPGRE